MRTRTISKPNALHHHSDRPSEAILARAPSLSFILLTVDKDCPNFHFVEIDKYWDWSE